MGDHISQLSGALDQVSDLLDRLRTLHDTLEGWRSKLKGHKPPHVLPKDVEAQLQSLSVGICFCGDKYGCDGYTIFVGNVQRC